MTTPTIVFVDGARVQLQPGSTVLDAVRARSAERASEVEQGALVITDSRGLPVPSDAAVHGGAIFRLVARRPATADGGESGEADVADGVDGPEHAPVRARVGEARRGRPRGGEP